MKRVSKLVKGTIRRGSNSYRQKGEVVPDGTNTSAGDGNGEYTTNQLLRLESEDGHAPLHREVDTGAVGEQAPALPRSNSSNIKNSTSSNNKEKKKHKEDKKSGDYESIPSAPVTTHTTSSSAADIGSKSRGKSPKTPQARAKAGLKKMVHKMNILSHSSNSNSHGHNTTNRKDSNNSNSNKKRRNPLGRHRRSRSVDTGKKEKEKELAAANNNKKKPLAAELAPIDLPWRDDSVICVPASVSANNISNFSARRRRTLATTTTFNFTTTNEKEEPMVAPRRLSERLRSSHVDTVVINENNNDNEPRPAASVSTSVGTPHASNVSVNMTKTNSNSNRNKPIASTTSMEIPLSPKLAPSNKDTAMGTSRYRSSPSSNNSQDRSHQGIGKLANIPLDSSLPEMPVIAQQQQQQQQLAPLVHLNRATTSPIAKTKKAKQRKKKQQQNRRMSVSCDGRDARAHHDDDAPHNQYTMDASLQEYSTLMPPTTATTSSSSRQRHADAFETETDSIPPLNVHDLLQAPSKLIIHSASHGVIETTLSRAELESPHVTKIVKRMPNGHLMISPKPTPTHTQSASQTEPRVIHGSSTRTATTFSTTTSEDGAVPAIQSRQDHHHHHHHHIIMDSSSTEVSETQQDVAEVFLSPRTRKTRPSRPTRRRLSAGGMDNSAPVHSVSGRGNPKTPRSSRPSRRRASGSHLITTTVSSLPLQDDSKGDHSLQKGTKARRRRSEHQRGMVTHSSTTLTTEESSSKKLSTKPRRRKSAHASMTSSNMHDTIAGGRLNSQNSNKKHPQKSKLHCPVAQHEKEPPPMPSTAPTRSNTSPSRSGHRNGNRKVKTKRRPSVACDGKDFHPSEAVPLASSRALRQSMVAEKATKTTCTMTPKAAKRRPKSPKAMMSSSERITGSTRIDGPHISTEMSSSERITSSRKDDALMKRLVVTPTVKSKPKLQMNHPLHHSFNVMSSRRDSLIRTNSDNHSQTEIFQQNFVVAKVSSNRPNTDTSGTNLTSRAGVLNSNNKPSNADPLPRSQDSVYTMDSSIVSEGSFRGDSYVSALEISRDVGKNGTLSNSSEVNGATLISKQTNTCESSTSTPHIDSLAEEEITEFSPTSVVHSRVKVEESANESKSPKSTSKRSLKHKASLPPKEDGLDLEAIPWEPLSRKKGEHEGVSEAITKQAKPMTQAIPDLHASCGQFTYMKSIGWREKAIQESGVHPTTIDELLTEEDAGRRKPRKGLSDACDSVVLSKALKKPVPPTNNPFADCNRLMRRRSLGDANGDSPPIAAALGIWMEESNAREDVSPRKPRKSYSFESQLSNSVSPLSSSKFLSACDSVVLAQSSSKKKVDPSSLAALKEEPLNTTKFLGANDSVVLAQAARKKPPNSTSLTAIGNMIPEKPQTSKFLSAGDSVVLAQASRKKSRKPSSLAAIDDATPEEPQTSKLSRAGDNVVLAQATTKKKTNLSSLATIRKSDADEPKPNKFLSARDSVVMAQASTQKAKSTSLAAIRNKQPDEARSKAFADACDSVAMARSVRDRKIQRHVSDQPATRRLGDDLPRARAGSMGHAPNTSPTKVEGKVLDLSPKKPIKRNSFMSEVSAASSMPRLEPVFELPFGSSHGSTITTFTTPEPSIHDKKEKAHKELAEHFDLKTRPILRRHSMYSCASEFPDPAPSQTEGSGVTRETDLERPSGKFIHALSCDSVDLQRHRKQKRRASTGAASTRTSQSSLNATDLHKSLPPIAWGDNELTYEANDLDLSESDNFNRWSSSS